MGPTPTEVLPLAATAAEEVAADPARGPQRFVIEMAVILIAARLGGRLFQRGLRLPRVIGELLAGVLIGPFALGALPLPGFGPLFPRIPGTVLQISPEIYAIATLASLLLLFLSGLETDLAIFLRYFTVGSAVGIGGVVVSFFAGALFAQWTGFAPVWYAPPALFLGAVSTATSVGITARILSEQHKTDSPEGVTVLAAAVLDDVLGIVILAIVLALSKAGSATPDWARIGVLAARALGIWLGCTALGILAARRLGRLLKAIGTPEAIAVHALGLALLLAGLMEAAGLAMIIGAYIMGLSLSRTDLALEIRRHLRGAHNLLVPVFFCVMGMLIDLAALRTVFWSGLAFAVLAGLAKVLGCGGPALATRFNPLGALRIGLGMMPRGEVALIIAGIGLSMRAVGSEIFGLAVLMTVLTTLAAPPLLVASFQRGSGVRAAEREGERRAETVLDLAHRDLAEFLMHRIAGLFRQEEFFVTPLSEDPPTYQIRKDQMVFTLRMEGPLIKLSSPAAYADVGRFVLLEEVLALKDVAESLKHGPATEALGGAIAETLFEPE